GDLELAVRAQDERAALSRRTVRAARYLDDEVPSGGEHAAEDRQPTVVEQAADVVDVADADVANAAAEQATARSRGDHLMEELAVAARLADGEIATGELLRQLERAREVAFGSEVLARSLDVRDRGDDLRVEALAKRHHVAGTNPRRARDLPLDLFA